MNATPKKIREEIARRERDLVDLQTIQEALVTSMKELADAMETLVASEGIRSGPRIEA